MSNVYLDLSFHPYVYSFFPARDQRQVDGEKGVWLNHFLTFSEVKQEDFYVNYSCEVYSYRGSVEAQFTLLPAGQRKNNYDSGTSLLFM